MSIWVIKNMLNINADSHKIIQLQVGLEISLFCKSLNFIAIIKRIYSCYAVFADLLFYMYNNWFLMVCQPVLCYFMPRD